MDLQAFELELRARGGAADVWLVYVEDSRESLIHGAPALKLQRAFWTRGEAYAFAHGAHEQRRWQHFHVFRVAVDVEWLHGDSARTAEFEMAFGRSREPLRVDLMATQIVAVMEPV